jgi:hypothetical protein
VVVVVVLARMLAEGREERVPVYAGVVSGHADVGWASRMFGESCLSVCLGERERATTGSSTAEFVEKEDS